MKNVCRCKQFKIKIMGLYKYFLSQRSTSTSTLGNKSKSFNYLGIFNINVIYNILLKHLFWQYIVFENYIDLYYVLYHSKLMFKLILARLSCT